jgi:hypothetical protein
VHTRSEAQEQEFDRIRAGRTVTDLTDEQVQAIAHQHYFNTLLVDEISRTQGLSEEQYEALQIGIDEGEARGRSGTHLDCGHPLLSATTA